MLNDTYVNANQQPASGAVQTYGEEFDITYGTNTSWRARGESLKGDGTALLSKDHIFLEILLDKPELEGEGAYAKISYGRIWYLVSAGIVRSFSSVLLDAAPLFQLKLHRIAKVLRDVKDAGLMPKGPLSDSVAAVKLSDAIRSLPANQRGFTIDDIVKQVRYAQQVSSTVFDHLSYRRMLQQDSNNGALIRQCALLFQGGYRIHVSVIFWAV